MRRHAIGFSAVVAAAAIVAPASAGWVDNFDSYVPGPLIPQSTWEPWASDPGAGNFVCTVSQALSAPHSVAVDGPDDAVHQYFGYTSGPWVYTAWQFIPETASGNATYFILCNTYVNGGAGTNWSTQVSFNPVTNLVTSEFDGSTLGLIEGQWVEIRVEIDLDADTQSIYYGGSLLVTKSWTAGVSGGGALNIGCVDLWANNTSYETFYDDMSLHRPCQSDINGDGAVDVVDFLALLAAWVAGGGYAPEDINGDGVVNVVDLLQLFAAWGPCP